MEYLNLYDKDGSLLPEKGIRGEKNENLVGIVIIFIENSKGEFLIQKTSSSRNSVFATTGGHVSYGSTFLETIIKEVKEELGIDVSDDNIVEINTYIRERYIQKVFYLKKDIDINDIAVQEDEVEYVKWFSQEEIDGLINSNQFRESNIEGYRCTISKI
ncbi:MAG: NUDIX domain-containing protein [Clostridia bacterium]|nr:NUDIX domain-containing protein [Clostridia bacterium]